MKSIRIIGVWCEHPFQIYSAKPVIDKYKKQGCRVIIYTFKENMESCRTYLNIPIIDIINITNLIHSKTSLFTYIYELVFVRKNYSIVYNERRNIKEAFSHRIISLLTFFLKLPKNKVNQYYIKYARLINVLGLHPIIKFNCDLLISFTRVRHSMLLAGIKVRHISIMESWDHPVKDPYFINPDYSLTWNKSLANDTKEYQKLNRVAKIAPLKFRYIFERSAKPPDALLSSITDPRILEELAIIKDKDFILYPTTTSSAGIEHDGEMVLIDHLCQAIQNLNQHLYIKPKPNGPAGDYDIFKKYKNVIVGMYASDPDSRDMLDEDYHSLRYLLMRNAASVVNAGTTFVLEAALMDKKILQLNLNSSLFGGFGEFVKTEHLRKYILNDSAVSYTGHIEELSGFLQNIDLQYSQRLKKWITHWN